MKNLYIALTVLLSCVLFICVLFVFLRPAIESDRKLFFERLKKAQANIGESVIIGTDTLTILKYDIDSDDYLLSNYNRVDPIVVEKNIIKRYE
jgi:hypothetical protein